jgi:purine-binding chemotaxis protein CheW
MPQVVCFTVGPYRCALDVMRVREVIPARPASPMPGAGALVEGVVELRGALLPVVDLRRRLGTPVTGAGQYVVVVVGDQRVALAVDSAHEVRRWDDAAVQPAPTLGGIAEAVAGVVHRGDEMVLLLDVDRLLDAEALAGLTTA